MPDPKPRVSARISLSKLGEYLGANALRRRAIVKDQKKPRTIYVARYAKAEDAIQNFIAGGGRDIEQLVAVARELATGEYESDWKRESAALCSKALHAFVKIAGDVPLEGLLPKANHDGSLKMNLAGVAVSVRPDILFTRPEAPDVIVGGLKLYFSKTHPLETGAGEFVASVVYRHIAEILSNETATQYRNCHVLDVFAGRIFTAPKSYRNHMRHAEALCWEIAALWPQV